MNYLILTDCFYPENKSASRHICDLASELIKKNNISIICPSYKKKYHLEKKFNIIRVRSSNLKNKNLILRGFAELILPFQYLIKIYKINKNIDKIIVYSPSIFFGLIFKLLKKKFNSKIILLLRDVFPDWAKQIGIFKQYSLFYFFLKFIARFQYEHSDVICLQSKKDFFLIKKFYKFKAKRILLYNWLKSKGNKTIIKKKLKKIKKFVFAGTMGPAQNWENIIYAINEVGKIDQNIKFYFIGNGILEKYLKKSLIDNRNVIFKNSLRQEKFLNFIKSCDAGILSLNKKILFDNFPGKFFSYIEANLPVVADISRNHELFQIIKKYNLGYCNDPSEPNQIVENILHLSNKININYKKKIKNSYDKLLTKQFSSEIAANKIINI